MGTSCSSRYGVTSQLALESVGGAVPIDSQFYIERSTDGEFHEAIARHESVVLVKGSRQVGKTSLLARGLQKARESGATVIFTDFQKLNASDLTHADTFYITLADLVAEQLDLPVLPRDVWKSEDRSNTNFERYLKNEVLRLIPNRLVWGFDELDRLFAVDYASEVFALFRAWHNERVLDPRSPWGSLTLLMSYSTEASLFIGDLNHSPFNVGTRLTLEDFDLNQVAELNRLSGSPLRNDQELGSFHRFVGGHPFLVRRGLHELSSRPLTYDLFEKEADSEDGIFGDHLRRIPLLLAEDPGFREIVRGMLNDQICPTFESFERLRSAGLVVGTSENDVRPRCELYTRFLLRQLA